MLDMTKNQQSFSRFPVEKTVFQCIRGTRDCNTWLIGNVLHVIHFCRDSREISSSAIPRLRNGHLIFPRAWFMRVRKMNFIGFSLYLVDYICCIGRKSNVFHDFFTNTDVTGFRQFARQKTVSFFFYLRPLKHQYGPIKRIIIFFFLAIFSLRFVSIF